MIERYLAMRTEVRKAAYEGLTSAEIREAVMARTVPILVPVTPLQITRVLQKRDKWHEIVMWAERVTLTSADVGTAPWIKVGVAMRIVEAMNRRVDFDLSDPTTKAAVVAGLDGLIAVGLLDADDKAAVLALADGFTSIAERDGFPDPTEQEIATERARVGDE